MKSTPLLSLQENLPIEFFLRVTQGALTRVQFPADRCYYQLDLVTPGISPANARLRKQMRQS